MIWDHYCDVSIEKKDEVSNLQNHIHDTVNQRDCLGLVCFFSAEQTVISHSSNAQCPIASQYVFVRKPDSRNASISPFGFTPKTCS